MKRWTVISSVVSTLFVASILTFSLSTEIASAHGPACKGHHKDDCNAGGESGTVRVDVTFRVSGTDGLRPIGGTYYHKRQKVSAGIGGLGEFTLTLTKGNQLAMRMLTLDFTDCVSQGTDHACKPPFQPDKIGDSVGPLTIATTRVDLLALGTDEMSTNLRLSLNLDLNLEGGGSWHHGYADDGFGICPGGTDIKVTRIDDETWVIEATSADKACLVKRDGSAMGDIPSGLYSMPFKMMVKKQN